MASRKYNAKFCQQIMMSSLVLQFIDDLQQSITRSLDAWSMILTFEVIVLIVPFYLTKIEDRAKRCRYLAYSYQDLDGGGRGIFSSPPLQNELLKSPLRTWLNLFELFYTLLRM